MNNEIFGRVEVIKETNYSPGIGEAKACFKRRVTAVLSWLECSSTAARH